MLYDPVHICDWPVKMHDFYYYGNKKKGSCTMSFVHLNIASISKEDGDFLFKTCQAYFMWKDLPQGYCFFLTAMWPDSTHFDVIWIKIRKFEIKKYNDFTLFYFCTKNGREDLLLKLHRYLRSHFRDTKRLWIYIMIWFYFIRLIKYVFCWQSLYVL